ARQSAVMNSNIMPMSQGVTAHHPCLLDPTLSINMQLYHYLFTGFGVRNYNQATPRPFDTETHLQVRFAEIFPPFLWPLNDTQAVIANIIAYPHVLEFLPVHQTIKIEMKYCPPLDIVGFHQGKGRAL